MNSSTEDASVQSSDVDVFRPTTLSVSLQITTIHRSCYNKSLIIIKTRKNTKKFHLSEITLFPRLKFAASSRKIYTGKYLFLRFLVLPFYLSFLAIVVKNCVVLLGSTDSKNLGKSVSKSETST